MRRALISLLAAVALMAGSGTPVYADGATPSPQQAVVSEASATAPAPTQPSPNVVSDPGATASAPAPSTPTSSVAAVPPTTAAGPTTPSPAPSGVSTGGPSQASPTTPSVQAAAPSAAAATPVPVSPGVAAIATKYAELGGPSGRLGAASGDPVCTADGGCYQIFSGGRIYWSQATGAWSVTGRVLTAYLAAGEPGAGVAGYPIADTETLSASAEWQAFQRAALYAGDATGSWFALGSIGAKYQALGGPAGRMGMPTGPETCGLRSGGCYQMYENGAIVWSSSTGARISVGAIRRAWAAYGYENGRMGYPITDEVCGLRSGGCYQMYEGGAIVWSPGTGAHISVGGIRDTWAAYGYENGRMGYPTTDEVCGLRSGGCYQSYEAGAIVWSPGTGAHISVGGIRGTWAAYGYENGRMGYPTTDEVCGLRDGGCYQMYEGGAIVWSAGTGAHISVGGIRDAWAGQGYENGWLRYPTTDEICSGSDCIQRFQGGAISWRNGTARTYGYNECDYLNDSRSVYSSQGARSVTFAVAEAYGSSSAWIIRCMNIAGIYVNDWATPGTVGASGFKAPGVPSGPTRDLYSPSGSYSMTDAFGLGNPGTALNYINLNPNSRWGGNPWTPTYNTYFESSSWVGYDENMWYFATRPQHDYRQGAVINYNRPPDSDIVQDAGFAIFLHENPVPTAGCVAIPDWYMVDWLQKAVPGDRFIMGVRGDIFR
ncbi:hypothetical protein [Sinomonas notoginsengisoli]|uniref:hypothetical protein n=1 Tax=Sinomonas notoginsengisoli TaxID=1457311 RepID=UPI001F3BF186|nr:hypothetical protein [Sinomonas notoginsengisoli]